MRVLIGCECSGVVRRAFRARGHDAWSCDLLPAEDGDRHHLTGDVRKAWATRSWDLAIMHPDCTRLANSGVRWLSVPPAGKTHADMWRAFLAGVDFYRECRAIVQQIGRGAIENPVMHRYAREAIRPGAVQYVQPWYFRDPFFKRTGLELVNVPRLCWGNPLAPPRAGTAAHKAWSAVHRASPGPNRAHDRSVFFPGIAAAMADQWGDN